jgi:Protein of unknown function (DUF3570)
VQLDSPERSLGVRSKLRIAACLLLTAAAPVFAQEAAPPPTPPPPPTDQIDFTGLFYGERISVLEPMIRYTRTYASGRSFFGQLSIDSVTGASPNGALPSGQTQTVTSASGSRQTVSLNTPPTVSFSDTRIAVDGEFQQPVKVFTFALGGHFSHEKDYRSEGVTTKVAIDLNHKLTTLNLGGSYNNDLVFPVGGTLMGMAPYGEYSGATSNPKHVKSALVGLSQVVSRRWLVGVSATRSFEDGYLTDPYKGLSIINATTGLPVSMVSEQRPGTRQRSGVQADSVYHFTSDILYLSYRYYWDDWGVGSHAIDARYRLPVDLLALGLPVDLPTGESAFVEPHVRFYTQTAADFYHFGFIQGARLPQYATSDYRLAALQTVTLGVTMGLKTGEGPSPNEWTVRAEYIGQFGDSSPPGTVGVQRSMNLFPTINAFTLAFDYRFNR